MQVVGIPFVNGLGKTLGCEATPFIFFKKIKIKKKIIEVDLQNVGESIEEIYKKSRELIKNQKKVFFVGGDHSITFPIARAFFEKFKKGTLIVLDAHVDCMQPMPEPTNEEWVRALIERKITKSEKIFFFGVRKIYKEERNFLKKEKVNFFKTFEEIKNIKSPIYLSIDIDVLDPSFAPGTSYKEKKGISLAELLTLIKKIKTLNLKVCDLVEINLKKELKKTFNSARKIFLELLE